MPEAPKHSAVQYVWLRRLVTDDHTESYMSHSKSLIGRFEPVSVTHPAAPALINLSHTEKETSCRSAPGRLLKSDTLMLEETSALLGQVHTIIEKREQELEQVCLARGYHARTRRVLN